MTFFNVNKIEFSLYKNSLFLFCYNVLSLDLKIALKNFFCRNLRVVSSNGLIEKSKKDKENEIKTLAKYLSDNGYINGSVIRERQLELIKELFDVDDLSFLEIVNPEINYKESSYITPGSVFAQNCWINLVIKEAKKINLDIYNKEELLKCIPLMRSCTLKKAEDFYEGLQKILAKCGVAFVILPYMPNSGIYGITKWLDKEHVVIGLSNRGKRADLFWFTFFHELGHVLQGNKKTLYLSDNITADFGANKIAADFLIPKNEREAFTKKKDFTFTSVLDFAKQIKILPSIVLGRLHKENLLDYSKMDCDLKVNYIFKGKEILTISA